MNDQPEIFDLAVVAELRESVGGDEAFVKELVGAYLAASRGYLDAIAAAAARGDATAVVRPAHTLKSSSAALGAMRLAAVSKQLEFAARDGHIDQPTLAEAQTLWPATLAALKAAGLTE